MAEAIPREPADTDDESWDVQFDPGLEGAQSAEPRPERPIGMDGPRTRA